MIPIENVLFDAFANSFYSDSQSYEILWAIHEGIARIDPNNRKFRDVKARKKHECVRGCEIKDGHVYFHGENGGAWGSEIKLCARCMAMILYYQRIQILPPVYNTNWDPTLNKPIKTGK